MIFHKMFKACLGWKATSAQRVRLQQAASQETWVAAQQGFCSMPLSQNRHKKYLMRVMIWLIAAWRCAKF